MAFKISGTTVINDSEQLVGVNVVTVTDNVSLQRSPPPMSGTVSGYTSGGNGSNVIDKFSFSADGNATDVGDLTQTRGAVAGQSSDVSGYTSGGFASSPGDPALNTIDKFPFAADANATDVGDLTVATMYSAGQSSVTFGYTSRGGAGVPAPTAGNQIDKFPFAADANATDVGDLTIARSGRTGHSSSISGYVSGGGPPGINVIEKFSFAVDANATDVGDLAIGGSRGAGQSSDANGYNSSGNNTSGDQITAIQKFSFASDGNATNVADVIQARQSLGSGQSSTVSGYTSGGYQQFVGSTNTIDKFPFTTDANSTDVGDLTQSRSNVAGQQD